VVLIACANVANLFLCRAAARHKEFAVRAALGAGRGRLIRPLLTESMLVGGPGGLLGLLLAALGVQSLVHLVQQSFPVLGVETVSVDRWVLGFTLLISLATGLFSGLVPALGSSKLDLNEALTEGGRSATGGVHRNRIRNTLEVFETSLALVLLSGAGLMVRSLLLLEQVKPGLNSQNILVLDFSLYSSRYAHIAPRAAFFQEVLNRLKALPGVQAAAVVADIPMGGGVDHLGFTIEGRPKPAPDQPLGANFNVVGQGYFRALGIPLLKGRDFTEQDVESAPGVIVINQAMARRFWPGTDPTGQRISTDGRTWFTIVGVAADARQRLTTEANPEVYLSHLQDPEPWPYLSVLVRTGSDPP
jgi:putative ABC transport system permease protein